MLLLKYILPLAMIFMASGSFCAELKTVKVYSEKFFQYGNLIYNEGQAIFVKDCYAFNYVAEDTVLIKYSTNLKNLDSVYIYHPYIHDGAPKVMIAEDGYLFQSRAAAIVINSRDIKDIKTYPLGKHFYTFIMTEDYLYGVNSIPGSMNPENIQFQRFLLSDKENWKSDTSYVELPPVKGFPLMYATPRMEVAFFQDYLVVADPCIESLYYYDFSGKPMKTLRLDSLLGITGICGQFDSFKVDKRVPQRSFDRIMDIKESNNILRSVENYKDRLLVRIATGSEECDTYIIEPQTLKWKKLAFENKRGSFGAENIPIDNFTVIDGDYIINRVSCDIKDIDLSRFANYEEFVKYTEENKNTGTSYLVREIVFE